MRGSPPSPPGVRDLHQVGRRDLEALQSAHRDARLHLRLKLDEGNPRLARHQPHLLEAGELREEHREHHLVDLVWQVLHEQDRVRQVGGGRGGCGGRRRRGGRRHLGVRGLLARRLWRGRLLLLGARLALLALRPSLCGALLPHLCEVRAVELRRRVRLGLCIIELHGLVIKGEALHLADRARRGGHVAEDDERLPSHLVALEVHNVDDRAKGGEDGVERLLHLLLVDLLRQVVDVHRLLWRVGRRGSRGGHWCNAALLR
mmetsp:Transcript_19476/g.62012  ORF Transcript_19476/g.62012 Transcript_19476/m.62012 type:complete len:260 (-) Transcript_19476:35-814(-)